MNFLSLPAKHLRGHMVRSLLTAGGIAIAIAGMFALVGLSRGFERNWVLSLEGKGTHIIAFQKGSIELLSAQLDENLTARIQAVPGVEAVMPGLGDMVELDSGQMTFLSGWPAGSPFWRNLEVVSGAAPRDEAGDAVVLGETLARMLGKATGDTIQLSGRDFRVAAITRQASVLDDRSVMMTLVTMQRLLGREGKVSGFHVRVRAPDAPGELHRVQAALNAAVPELSFTESTEVARNAHVARLLRAIAWASSAVATSMAFLAVLNTLLISVTQRTRQIGLLCAVGWHPARIMALVLFEGLILSAAGAAAGLALGLACLRWIAAHPQMGGLLQPDVTPALIADAAGMALLLGLCGGLYPAWRATRLNPMDLLRAE